VFVLVLLISSLDELLSSGLQLPNKLKKEFNIPDQDYYENNSSYNVSLVIKVKNKPSPKPGLKCGYCNLKYCLEEERKQHEEFWHGNKIKM
jgi:uncharacterized ferredoxin-like protein